MDTYSDPSVAICEPSCFTVFLGESWLVDVTNAVQTRQKEVRFDENQDPQTISTTEPEIDVTTDEDTTAPKLPVTDVHILAVGKTPLASILKTPHFPASLGDIESEPIVDWSNNHSSVFWIPPPTKTKLIYCRLTRFRKDGDAIYYLHLDNPEQTFLMASVKRKDSGTSNFSISSNKSNMNKTSPSYLGRVRSRLGRKLFSIYDNGENPSKSTDSIKNRRELGAVSYISTPSEIVTCKMIVCIPEVSNTCVPVTWRPSHPSKGLLDKFYNEELEEMTVLETKDPHYDPDRKVYSLDFKGRVKVGSLKNFQLCCSTQPNDVILQFGRVEKDAFILDFKYPLNAYQAFAIALTRFDTSLA